MTLLINTDSGDIHIKDVFVLSDLPAAFFMYSIVGLSEHWFAVVEVGSVWEMLLRLALSNATYLVEFLRAQL